MRLFCYSGVDLHLFLIFSTSRISEINKNVCRIVLKWQNVRDFEVNFLSLYEDLDVLRPSVTNSSGLWESRV